MNLIRFAVLFLLMLPIAVAAQTPPPPPAQPPPPPPVPPAKDQWAALSKYQEANAQLPPRATGEKRIVFFGDSITEAWARDKNFFPGKKYIGRGISGQTTTQMLIRFRQDVLNLHPAVVLILAGTNDIAENLGPTSLQSIEDNLQSMAELAEANHIHPIFCSILPAFDYGWHKGLNPPPKIAEVNKWMEAYCNQHHLAYCNYFPVLADARPGMKPELSGDGVHPNSDGYALMEPIAEAAIKKALHKH
jgi:lysophospholipase L1-like esterase